MDFNTIIPYVAPSLQATCYLALGTERTTRDYGHMYRSLVINLEVRMSSLERYDYSCDHNLAIEKKILGLVKMVAHDPMTICTIMATSRFMTLCMPYIRRMPLQALTLHVVGVGPERVPAIDMPQLREFKLVDNTNKPFDSTIASSFHDDIRNLMLVGKSINDDDMPHIAKPGLVDLSIHAGMIEASQVKALEGLSLRTLSITEINLRAYLTGSELQYLPKTIKSLSLPGSYTFDSKNFKYLSDMDIKNLYLDIQTVNIDDLKLLPWHSIEVIRVKGQYYDAVCALARPGTHINSNPHRRSPGQYGNPGNIIQL